LSNNIKKKLIVVCGATASGKSAWAEALATAFNCPVLSADSRQFYKEIPIGTAQPDEVSLRNTPYHFIANKSVTDYYSAGDFERDALALLEQIYIHHDIAIVVGGSGLYIKALLHGMDEEVKVDLKYRTELISQYEQKGFSFLEKQLPEEILLKLNSSDRQNPQRLMRLIEKQQQIETPIPLSPQVGLRLEWEVIQIAPELSREDLYKRIDHRVDEMMHQGLLEEAKNVYHLRHHNALQTVGYNELFDYMDGKITIEYAIEKIKQHTRNFAKRQITWFKRDASIEWMNINQLNEAVQIIKTKYQ
jgi:tRNA dimethylallyltransferase